MIRSEMKVAIRRSPWRLAVVVGVTVLTVLTGGSLQAAVPGTATVSGTVTASQPFQAAQVEVQSDAGTEQNETGRVRPVRRKARTETREKTTGDDLLRRLHPVLHPESGRGIQSGDSD